MLGAILKQVEHIPWEIEAALERPRNQPDNAEPEYGEILKLLISSPRHETELYLHRRAG